MPDAHLHDESKRMSACEVESNREYALADAITAAHSAIDVCAVDHMLLGQSTCLLPTFNARSHGDINVSL